MTSQENESFAWTVARTENPISHDASTVALWRHRRLVHAQAAHLPPGGSFIFDLNLAYAFEQKMFNQQGMSKSSKVRYRWRGDYDPQTCIIQVNMQFWVGEQHFTETHNQRAYEIEEVVDLLDEAGFRDIRVFESYTLNPPREKSDRVHFACVKM